VLAWHSGGGYPTTIHVEKHSEASSVILFVGSKRKP
jgi:hypothetical protein